MEYLDELRQMGWEIGEEVVIEKGVFLDAEYGRIGSYTHIGKNVRIQAQRIEIGENCLFFPNVDIKVRTFFSMDFRGKIGRNTCFRANSISIGHDLWCNELVEVGGGGWMKETADLTIGDFVHVGKGVSLNVCCPVTIGSYTGIGIECMVFTHSSGNGQSILEGYKHIEAPVRIGSHVSLFTRDIIAPGAVVEDYVTVAAMSYVRGTTEERGFYAGCPAVLKYKTSPVPRGEWYEMIRCILKEEIGEVLYEPLSEVENLEEPVVFIKEMKEDYRSCLDHFEKPIVISTAGKLDFEDTVVFDIDNMMVTGSATTKTEMVRNTLRRNGMLFEFGENYEPGRLSYDSLVNSGIERL